MHLCLCEQNTRFSLRFWKKCSEWKNEKELKKKMFGLNDQYTDNFNKNYLRLYWVF